MSSTSNVLSSRKAEVIFVYAADQEDELNLAVGDVITNIDMEDEGWWVGDLNGQRGLFPENFVKLIEDDGPSEGKPATKEQESLTKARVLFDYDATEEDELDLKKGDIIEVVQEEDEGWCEGKHNGKVGMFPSNFVEIITDDAFNSNAAITNDKPSSEEKPTLIERELVDTKTETKHVSVDKEVAIEETQPIEEPQSESKKPKPPMGFGFLLSNADLTKSRLRPVSGTLDDAKMPSSKVEEAHKPTQRVPPLGQADITSANLKKVEPPMNGAAGTKRNAPAPPIPPPNQERPALAPPPHHPPTTGQGERHKAKFEYTPDNEDEIALNVGDIVMVTNKDVCEGWWEGTVNGKTGVFPNNFVEPAPLPTAVVADKSKEKMKKPLLPQMGKAPNLPTKKADHTNPIEVNKQDARLPPSSAKRPMVPESKKPLLPEPEKALHANTAKPDSGKPDISKPGLPKPELKKPPPPAAKSKPPKPNSNKPNIEEPAKPNILKSIPNNSSVDRVRLPSAGKRPPGRPPADHSLPSHGLPQEFPSVAKDPALPSRPDKLKVEPEKTEEHAVDFDSISSGEVLQNVNKTRPKGPGKTLPAKYNQPKSPSTQEPVETEQPKPPPSTTPASTFTTAATNEAIEQLKQNVSSVQSKMSEMEKKFLKHIKVLTDDLDAERKERANMQIELDRLKKKVSILEDERK